MANHTTPIDVVILANDGCYAMVSVIHRGVSFQMFGRGDVTALPSLSSTGGSDSRRSDGGHPEVDGEVVSPCLV